MTRLELMYGVVKRQRVEINIHCPDLYSADVGVKQKCRRCMQTFCECRTRETRTSTTRGEGARAKEGEGERPAGHCLEKECTGIKQKQTIQLRRCSLGRHYTKQEEHSLHL